MTPQVGIPLSVSPLLMYVRRDILAAHLPPSGALTTWSHLINLAATLNGTTDSDGDGRADYALCLPLHVPCSAASLLTAVLASLVQTKGTQSVELWSLLQGRYVSSSPSTTAKH
jgi:hypothetical protein